MWMGMSRVGALGDGFGRARSVLCAIAPETGSGFLPGDKLSFAPQIGRGN
jgi:hypothetical protein